MFVFNGIAWSRATSATQVALVSYLEPTRQWVFTVFYPSEDFAGIQSENCPGALPIRMRYIYPKMLQCMIGSKTIRRKGGALMLFRRNRE